MLYNQKESTQEHTIFRSFVSKLSINTMKKLFKNLSLNINLKLLSS
jgi:hypothetical protein